PRWQSAISKSSAQTVQTRFGISSTRLSFVLGLVTVTFLTYCLTSAFNAAATYDRTAQSFIYHQHYLTWLPHSFDSNRSWFIFWEYLGLACSFWVVRDWLGGKSTQEVRHEHLRASQDHGVKSFFPARLRRLLWLLAINGGLLAIEGIIQRLEGSGRLL